ncbi:HAD family hydrolase [Flavobacterium soli]|uniref:HAD family hydrolase n=1 Tax=Flavobacterium soli TaxID=344881 RepID=UPI00041E466B|nr:HAD family phosphatase [Flavobacterium soli]
MIEAIIFDFGDIFINLNKDAMKNAFNSLGLKEWNDEMKELNLAFEVGKISEEKFLSGLQKHIPNASMETIKKNWNAILMDFPLYRLEFLQMLSQKHRLFLLSNTDSIHIQHFEETVGESFYSNFYQCFEKVYFSFELGMRKPNEDIYNYVLQKHNLSPKRTLFVDDKKENTDSALKLGIQVWNLQVGQEDVVDLFDKKLL